MSNYELLSVVVESLIRKTAELEQKNADLEGQVKKSNEEKQSLQFALELQEDINHSLRDDLKKKDTKIAQLEAKNAKLADQVQKSTQETKKLKSDLKLKEGLEFQVQMLKENEEELESDLKSEETTSQWLRANLREMEAKLVRSKHPIKAYKKALKKLDECRGDREIIKAMIDLCETTGYCGTLEELADGWIRFYEEKWENKYGEVHPTAKRNARRLRWATRSFYP